MSINAASLLSNPGILAALYPGINLTAFSQMETEQEAALQAPVEALASQASNLQSVISAWQSIQSAVQNLQTDAQNLSEAATWNNAQATTSDPSVVSAAASETTQNGTYTVNITTTGTTDQWLGQGVSSETTALGLQGTFSINGASISVTSQNSLQDIASAINSAASGASAQVLSSTNGTSTTYYLSVASTKDQELQISDPNGIFAGGGSSGLGMTATQTGQAWAYSVNGVATTSTTGTDSVTVPGLTLSLTGAGTAQVQVTSSTSQAEKDLASFTSDYNALQSLISQDTGKGAILEGDPTAEGIMTQVNQILLSTNTGAPTGFQSAADAGVTLKLQSDNSTTLDFSQSTFDAAAQANPEALQAIFAGNSGMMSQLSTVLTNLGSSATSGIITGAITNAQNQVKSLQTQESQEQALINLQVSAMQANFNQEMQALLAVTQQQSAISSLFDQLQNPGGTSSSSSKGG